MCNANESASRKSLTKRFDCDEQFPSAIKPPPQFQDAEDVAKLPDNILQWTERFATKLVAIVLEEALSLTCKMSLPCPKSRQNLVSRRKSLSGRWNGPHLCWTPELLPFSPCHNPRPLSRNSLSSSRLSTSHNSLAANKADDSSFITSAMSHDVLTGSEISDMYNVPFDSDIYALPIDVVKPRTPHRPKRQQRHHRKRRRQVISSSSQLELDHQVQEIHKPKSVVKSSQAVEVDATSSDCSKRHSVPGSSASKQLHSDLSEPIHMTLQEVRQYLQNLYSSSSDSSENKAKNDAQLEKAANNNNNNKCNDVVAKSVANCNFVTGANNNARKHKKKTFVINIKNKNTKDGANLECDEGKLKKNAGRNSFSTNLKQTLCNIFRLRKPVSPGYSGHGRRAVLVEVVDDSDNGEMEPLLLDATKAPFLKRALPPLPAIDSLDATMTDSGQIEEESMEDLEEEPSMDFASSIEKVKDYGWYWGPISGEAAERLLSNEPDGSFIVRDSSDDHYIFSLTFKLNGCIRHVRIEHDQGNFSFGSCTKFKSHTIVEFIENAVEHSRSGRYLFFLHRRPVLGPMRVQLLHPVSRYKQVQSLQHMCRFVILKLVRRDLILTLPLPRRVVDYLSTPHYYCEQQLEEETPGPSPTSEEALSS